MNWANNLESIQLCCKSRETLVIYNASDTEPAAQTVLNAMGVGRLVQNSGSYTFNTDVLVILGKDWKPAA